MACEVIVAPRAIEDLKDIVLYILPDRPEAATRLARALIEGTKVLADFPFLGRKVPEFDHPLIRELILHPYRIGLPGGRGEEEGGRSAVLAWSPAVVGSR